MKTIDVKICACTSCVMNGAMDLAESVEGLRKVRNELQIDADIRVEMSKCIGDAGHGEHSPVASVNGQIIHKADSETLMEKITELAK